MYKFNQLFWRRERCSFEDMRMLETFKYNHICKHMHFVVLCY